MARRKPSIRSVYVFSVSALLTFVVLSSSLMILLRDNTKDYEEIIKSSKAFNETDSDVFLYGEHVKPRYYAFNRVHKLHKVVEHLLKTRENKDLNVSFTGILKNYFIAGKSEKLNILPYTKQKKEDFRLRNQRLPLFLWSREFTELKISGNDFGGDEIATLSLILLMHSSSLKRLILEDCNIDEKAAQSLLESLKESSIEEITITPKDGITEETLKELENLTENETEKNETEKIGDKDETAEE